jgi:glycine betaine/choline ABC-type transport system substrate-binding protein
MTGRVAAAFVLLGVVAAPASAQVRLAAPADCSTNPNCLPGLERTYGVKNAPLVSLKVPDAGIEALDDGLAEVAVAFTSSPKLSRPDVTTLRDDKHMIGPDRVVPVIRSSVLKRYGRPLRRRLDEASALLSTLALRGLNQQVIDGRLPEAVGGEFADANGLGGRPARMRSGPRIAIGFQSFAENETLAYFYAEALRGGGFRTVVRPAGGLRQAVVNGVRSGRIDLWPAYDGSAREFLHGRTLRAALKRIGAEPLRLSRAQNRNAFVMKNDVAARLGIATLSDLARAWSGARAASVEPLQKDQWATDEDAVIDLPNAWRLGEGAGAVVAVVDSGTKLDHPDLAPNIWANFREVPSNGVDDDGNGYVDDVYGVDLTSTATGQNLSDQHGHGTHVAGIIGAARNGRGVIGVAPRARIMTVRVLAADGSGTTGAVAEGIRYAAAMGARVINASVQGNDPDPRLDDAIAVAGAANALVVVSAGNEGRDLDARPAYPASIPAPNLIAVAATGPDTGRTLDTYSNFGKLTVGVAAPGGVILSTTNDGAYGEKSGTSMAAPMVAGIAALMVGVNPGLSAVDLRARLLQYAARSSLPVSSGYADAFDAIRSVAGAVDTLGSQRPRVRILRAAAKGRRTQLQVSVTGATQAIKTYRVKLNGRRAGALTARRTSFTVTIRRSARRAQIDALDARGRVLASGRRTVKTVRAGKRGVRTGRGIGAS